eukprot:6670967-Prorocentrum_lima.AAC.1
MILRSFLTCCTPPDGSAIAEQDMFFVFDACHLVNMTKLLSCFVNGESQAVPKYQHKIFLSYDEVSLRSRKN